mmetsp:Transcript_17639/g.48718  ORF Transcript_17639/g.48718 Transcript_17639/m.48718 type:complete len:88 (+) Transcript_17639:380-643(+)
MVSLPDVGASLIVDGKLVEGLDLRGEGSAAFDLELVQNPETKEAATAAHCLHDKSGDMLLAEAAILLQVVAAAKCDLADALSILRFF